MKTSSLRKNQPHLEAIFGALSAEDDSKIRSILEDAEEVLLESLTILVATELDGKVAMMRTPDGHSRLELSRFIEPAIVEDHRTAPVNALGYLRVMFAVEDLDDTLVRLKKLGAELVGEVVNYENVYELCYIRGPEGILIGLAQQLNSETSRTDPMNS